MMINRRQSQGHRAYMYVPLFSLSGILDSSYESIVGSEIVFGGSLDIDSKVHTRRKLESDL